MTAYDVIYAVVSQIPAGKVATYGQIAELANLPRRARLVGYALYRLAPSDQVPWHRVINAKGAISQSPFRYGSDELQRSLLEQEGVEFSTAGTVNLRQYQWQPSRVESYNAEVPSHTQSGEAASYPESFSPNQ